jgi:hypothetical protein
MSTETPKTVKQGRDIRKWLRKSDINGVCLIKVYYVHVVNINRKPFALYN